MKASKAVLHLAAVLRNVSLGGDVQSRAPWLPAKLGLLYAQLGTESREVHLNLGKEPLSLFAKLVSAAPTAWGQRGKGCSVALGEVWDAVMFWGCCGL